MKLFGPKKEGLASRIEYRHFNERDVEIPALIDFLRAREGRFFSLLDVGAFGSHAYYAPLVKSLFPGSAYHGVDIKPDPRTAELLNRYHQGNVLELPLGRYDVVFSVSTIEHCGMTSYKSDDPAAERFQVFCRLRDLAKKYLFLTFPFGLEGEFPGEYANITAAELDRYAAACPGAAVKTRFFYNEFPQGREKWVAVDRKKASGVALRADRGVQCVCILEIEKPEARYRGNFPGITEILLKKTKALEPQPEYTPGREDYSMFNTGGVEIEVAEFLYSFVKMVKPRRILETGTHLGVSAMYMAKGLQENGGGGKIVTLEIFDENIRKSEALWRDTGVHGAIEVHKKPSLEYETQETFDVLFLDSEPDIRFDELLRFYPRLRPGGFILIHDLHPNLGLSGLVINGMKDWPFGDFRTKFGHLLKDFSLQTFTFRTPRGLVVFQKADGDFSHTRYLRETSREEAAR